MSELVPAEEIEQIVGARRHPHQHLGRADSSTETLYILHSQKCKDSGIDLRDCEWSKALDRGIDLYQGRLLPLLVPWLSDYVLPRRES
jgi:hypothetical protein